MSEEEKKAIEIIKKEITKPETTPLEVYVTDIKMLLHIIDKQQKEIEELNAEILELINQRTEGYWENDRLKEEIERLNQEIKKWAEKEHNLTQALLSKRTNSISKDKIREKVKEITKYYEKEVKPEMYQWGDFTAEEHYADIIAKYNELLEE